MCNAYDGRVCDAPGRRYRRRRCPPEQLGKGPRRHRHRREQEGADGMPGNTGTPRGCDSISLGTVILQRLPKLKRLDCFQRARMDGRRSSCHSVSHTAPTDGRL